MGAVAGIDLIDTTEMYLKTIYEMVEDKVVPMRARIVERLGHSGPTVSQTIARIERDGLVTVRDDRQLELTELGSELAEEVVRKHRLAECLLIDVIGLDWVAAHEEACRWEHVMSDEVEEKLSLLLQSPTTDPYGNPIPGSSQVKVGETSLEALAQAQPSGKGILSRIGEPVQADTSLLKEMAKLGLKPGTNVSYQAGPTHIEVWLDEDPTRPTKNAGEKVSLPTLLASHLFIYQGN